MGTGCCARTKADTEQGPSTSMLPTWGRWGSRDGAALWHWGNLVAPSCFVGDAREVKHALSSSPLSA